MNRLKVIELFSGIGAWSKALTNLNIDHEVVLAVDKEKHQMTAYNAIHGTNFIPQDITELDENTVPDCDIICYSPPCQAFSAAGKQLGFEDQRGVLFFDALRIIKAKKPKFTLMENVKNLTGKKFQFEFEAMMQCLEREGYRNYWIVLNAKNHGMCQNRERVFVISIRNDIEQRYKFPEIIPLKTELENVIDEDFEFPTNTQIKSCSLRTRTYMGQPQQLEIRKDNLSNTVTTVPKDSMIAIPLDDRYSIALKDRGEWKIKQDRIVSCIDANYWKGVDNHAQRTMLVNNEYFVRMLTTLECFRLMGFRDEDHMKAKEALNNTYYKGKNKSKSKLYQLAGNSIVVNVAEEIFKKLLLHNESKVLEDNANE